MNKAEKLRVHQALAEASCYRGFLREYFSIRNEKRPGYSLQAFSKVAGIRSKSLISEIMNGNKRITPGNLDSIILGLKLTGTASQYFRILVAVEEPDLKKQFPKNADIDKRLKNLKSKLNPKKILSSPVDSRTPYIYAALGCQEVGASIEEINQRTGISIGQLRKNLDELIKLRVVIEKSGRFYAGAAHVVADCLNQNQDFLSHYRWELQNLRNSTTKKESEKDLYFHSAISIDSKRKQEFQKRLNDLAIQLINEFEEPQGDSIESFVLGMYTVNPNGI